jgi:glycosyltransferase involved in cell wall biosynthesis
MKILFASNLYGESARGGAERIVAREAEELAARGHDVAVVSGEPPREVPKGVCLPGEPWLCPPPGSREEISRAYEAAVRRSAVPGKPRTIRYHPPNAFFYADIDRHGPAARFLWHLRDMRNARSAATFAEILALERPDVVHTHNLMGLGFLLPKAVRDAGIRHVHTVHDVQLIHPSGLLRGDGRRLSLAQRAYVPLMRSLMGSPEAVVFPSEFLKALHERLGFFPRSRRVVVRNPAPAAIAEPRPVPAAPRFLFVGQLERHKGVTLLLDAWEKAGLAAGASLEIAGDGSLAAETAARAAALAGVSMLGKLSGHDLVAAYDRASHVVVPSLVIENQPTVILEAMSRGAPVIAASTGGIPELVREGEHGALFPPGDADALAGELRRAAPLEGWAAMSAAAARAATGWSAGAHADALLRLYAASE